jgi:hypothetical protein
MNKLVRVVISACVWGVLCNGTAWGQQYLNLRPKLIPGDESYFRHEMRYRAVMRNQEGMGGKLTSVDSLAGCRLRVLDGQAPDHHPLELTFVALMHRMGRPVGMFFDSRVDDPAKTPEGRLVGWLLNRPFKLVVRDDGSVASVEGVEEFLQQPFEGVHEAVLNHYRALITPHAFEQLLLFNLLKDAPDEVLVGGTWVSQFVSPTGGGTAEMVRRPRFLLDTVKLVGTRPVATLTFSGEIELGEGPTSQPADGPQLQRLTGKEEGTIKFDVLNRHLTSVDYEQRIKIYMRWRIARAKMGVLRIVDQTTNITWRRSTLGALLRPPPPPRLPGPSATQPASTQPAASAPSPPQPGAGTPREQLAGAR